ncbi:MAG: hypothetical protein COV34_03365 [Candidatus Zambryskibacteria bacterium CG10_big_fil_rev_8_21_14_0_10_42_12]|uniref:Uncharacterized protein n=1 Tax=Candidatus Zambryskibacteria bacterium CG10_big_fil_rev_8_21_14_0_10_42_12 TaxID=1975115 RepID=A0A2H0QUK7_9BACT|nr:MAG: hypothetical protein COV34_03365 [Candidatus Zambryskibacteria bacterium CG10_big_fil_rev_8_21_14_0_10_42_12]
MRNLILALICAMLPAALMAQEISGTERSSLLAASVAVQWKFDAPESVTLLVPSEGITSEQIVHVTLKNIVLDSTHHQLVVELYTPEQSPRVSWEIAAPIRATGYVRGQVGNVWVSIASCEPDVSSCSFDIVFTHVEGGTPGEFVTLPLGWRVKQDAITGGL